ncbi:hypothetical protein M2352_000491 [Azospirillum fermentarium]|uniref:hypothetical protein n=1 Tax=Azospirillum fermentarium TaxID=1233114 RepID=UPI0022274056|nr:hypothetical protein [Azospirillum fermentarium]MCW2244900.1 hypothetical protein [Azospirillum fermentarium]
MTSPPPPVHLPVPVPQPAESPAVEPVRWRFRPRWPAVALLVLWAAAAVSIPAMRQQDARAVAAARAEGVAAEAAARLDAVVSVIRAAAGENRGAGAVPAVAAALSVLAPDGWLGIVRTDAYGAIAESRGTVRPAPAVLRGAVIAARPLVTVDVIRGSGGRDGTGSQPVVVVAVPAPAPAAGTGTAMTESVIAVVLAAHVWRLEGEEDAALLAPGCTLLAARPAGVGVTDAGRCRQRLDTPGGSAGLGRLGEEPEWGEVALRPAAPRTAAPPQTGAADGGGASAPWAVLVPVPRDTPAPLLLLWALGPAGVLLLGMPAGLPGALRRRWMRRRTAGRA